MVNIAKPQSISAIVQEGRDALSNGDPDKALALADGVLAKNSGKLNAGMLRAKCLQYLGRDDEADVVLDKLAILQPDNPQLKLQLARKFLTAGDMPAALDQIEMVLNKTPENLTAGLLRIRILAQWGHIAEARKYLRQLRKSDAGSAQVHVLGAQFARWNGNQKAALKKLDEALVCDNQNGSALLMRLQVLSELGYQEEASAALAQFKSVDGTSINLNIQLANWLLVQNDEDEALNVLKQVLAKNPKSFRLKRYLFLKMLRVSDADFSHRLSAWISTDASAPQIAELEASVHIRFCEFQKALELLRKDKSSQRNWETALLLSKALIGVHKAELAFRYMRLCARKWPTKLAFNARLFDICLKIGKYDEARKILVNLEDRELPSRDKHGPTFGHYLAHVGETEDSLKFLQNQHGADSPELMELKNLRSYVATFDLESAKKSIAWNRVNGGGPRSVQQKPSFDGALANELEIEIGFLGNEALTGSLEEDPDKLHKLQAHMSAHPRSFLTASKLIKHHVEVSQEAELTNYTPQIPNHIFQYWNEETVPERVAEMMQTWTDHPGFEHTVWNRDMALEFLRKEMGPKWVTAFHMANNIAEEADFFRLCVLFKNGGIYADADDVLNGSLSHFLNRSKGLVVTREKLGFVGNNFLAAKPKHPAITWAALSARRSLLSKDREFTWAKTGPGLITAAIGLYLVKSDPVSISADLMIIDQRDIFGQISMHNELPHKTTAAHWLHKPNQNSGLRNFLDDTLQAELDFETTA